jgi:methylase of polypeptide subunit release factors
MIVPSRQMATSDVADHYDELDVFYREVWGEHVHHGLWRTGREPSALAAMQLVDHVADALALHGGERVVDMGRVRDWRGALPPVRGSAAMMNAHRRTLTVFGETVALDDAPGVFKPSPHGMFYARSPRVEGGERVIDVGTGSGVLGIAAAKRGARVVATDVDGRAITAAEHNARLNGVRLETHLGPLFAGVTGTFDVILANLPNEIVAPVHLTSLPAEDARTFAGGAGGNEHLLALLAAAPAYMTPTSRLYLGVHGLTNYRGTLRAALDGYRVRLLDLEPLPVKEFVLQSLDFYQALARRGVIELFQDADGRWSSYGYLYELQRAHV